jgi:hypothetical protein
MFPVAQKTAQSGMVVIPQDDEEDDEEDEEEDGPLVEVGALETVLGVSCFALLATSDATASRLASWASRANMLAVPAMIPATVVSKAPSSVDAVLMVLQNRKQSPTRAMPGMFRIQ